ncbi:MAG: hypothetical protein KF878_17615 [Planctomycetes bacterium]|nr:hypothetical protein [Planctomycetota bacterium]
MLTGSSASTASSSTTIRPVTRGSLLTGFSASTGLVVDDDPPGDPEAGAHRLQRFDGLVVDDDRAR